MSWKKFRLHEYRLGHYVVVIDDKVVCPAKEREKLFFRALEVSEKISLDIIAVGPALGALSAVIATQDIFILLRILAIVVFLLSTVSAGMLYSLFLVNKIPETMLHVYQLGGWNDETTIWILRRWVKLFIYSYNTTPEQEMELAYLTLLAAFALMWLIIMIWIFISFIPLDSGTKLIVK